MKGDRSSLNAGLLMAIDPADRARLLALASEGEARAMLADWPFWARREQLAPSGGWRVWLMMAGRGFGKTRAGAEWVRGIAEGDGKARIALVGATMAEARAVMVEGESGLLGVAPPWERPMWEPSLRRLRWRSGAVATLHSAADRADGVSLDDSASWQPIGQTAPAAVIGQAATLLASAGAMLRDTAGSVDVVLLDDDMALAGSDATELSATTNLALIGDEMIQFATAEEIAPRTFRLGGLLRGRRGSEWAMAGHSVGDSFVLIDPDTMVAWPLPASAIGRTVRVSASGTGDLVAVEAAMLFQARAMRPPAPVALSAMAIADGSIEVRWTRRSRLGWDWLDDTDVPLAEESERYQLVVSRAGGRSTSLSATASSATLDAAMLAGIGGSGSLSIAVAQIGTTAVSLPAATITVPLGA